MTKAVTVKNTGDNLINYDRMPTASKAENMGEHTVMPVRNNKGNVFLAAIACIAILAVVAASSGLIGGCLWGLAGSNISMLVLGITFSTIAMISAGGALVSSCATALFTAYAG